jgi:hypothetical protein
MVFLKLDTYTGETYDVSAMMGLAVAYDTWVRIGYP